MAQTTTTATTTPAPAGGFDPNAVGADTSAPEFQLNTLFGVNQGVGAAPVVISARQSPAPGTEDFFAHAAAQQGSSSTLMSVLQGFYGMDPSALENLQRQLYAGGFYADSYYGKNPKTPMFGVPDEDSFAAFKAAAVRAARSGAPLGDIINSAATANAQKIAADQAAASQAARLSAVDNPYDIQAVANATAQATLGRDLTPDEIQKIVGQVQGYEYDQGSVGQAGIGQFVAQNLRASAPAEAHQMQANSLASTLVGMFTANQPQVQTIQGGANG